MKKLILVLAACAMATSAWAQDAGTDTVAGDGPKQEFSLGIDILARGELRDGGLVADDNDNVVDLAEIDDRATFLLERTRLWVMYERPWLQAYINMQHSGVWGEAGRGSFNLYEAWARVQSKQGLFAQVGRIALSYDDERIIGSDAYSM